MSSSSESRVVRGASADTATGLATPELRTGAWTRLGGTKVLGDAITEQTLSSLAEQARAAASSQGYAVGWAQGRREAGAAARLAAEETEQRMLTDEARREAEHRTSVAALERATAELRQALHQVCDHVAEQAAGLALEVTRELVGHELTVSGTAGEYVVRRALATIPDRAVARLRLHPAVAAAVTDVPESVSVVADDSLGAGDALVEVDEGVLDLRVDTALDRLRGVLG